MDVREPLLRQPDDPTRLSEMGLTARRSIVPIGRSHLFELSAREFEVLNHIRMGLTNRQIAKRLFVSTNTVNKHVQQVLRKLNVSNRVQAAIYTPGATN